MENKKWKVCFKKLPDEMVIDTMAPVIAKTKEEAIELALFGIFYTNKDKSDVKEIKIVSCEEVQ